MEKDYRILTLDYPMDIKSLEELADKAARLVLQPGLKTRYTSALLSEALSLSL